MRGMNQVALVCGMICLAVAVAVVASSGCGPAVAYVDAGREQALDGGQPQPYRYGGGGLGAESNTDNVPSYSDPRCQNASCDPSALPDTHAEDSDPFVNVQHAMDQEHAVLQERSETISR